MDEGAPKIDEVQVAYDKIKTFTDDFLPELKRRLDMHGFYRGKTFGEITYPTEEKDLRENLFQLLGVKLTTKEQTDELISRIDSLIEERKASTAKS